MFRGSFLSQKILVVFILLVLSVSQFTCNADESILFAISPNKSQFTVDLGIVQPKSVSKRTLLVTGARSSESDKLIISASCGCLSTTVGERTTERVLELHVVLASGSKDGKSEQKIDIIRESDSAVIGSLVFTQEVRSKITLSSYSVDVTDLLGGEVELAIVVPDVYKNEDVAITEVTGEGDWLAEAGVRLAANRQAILLSVKEKIDASLYAHETVHNPSYTVREDVYSRATGILSIATQEIYKICSRTHQCLPRCEADSQSVRICVIDTQTLVGSISGFVYHAPAMGPHQDPSLYNCAYGGNSGGGGGSNGGGGSGGGSGSGGNGSSSGGNYP